MIKSIETTQILRFLKFQEVSIIIFLSINSAKILLNLASYLQQIIPENLIGSKFFGFLTAYIEVVDE